MKRSGPIERTKAIARRKAMKKSNPARKAKAFARDFGSAELVQFVQSLPCLVKDCEGQSEAAHSRSRGAGGKATDLVPLCRRHHAEQHAFGVMTFQVGKNLDLATEAARIAREWEER